MTIPLAALVTMNAYKAWENWAMAIEDKPDWAEVKDADLGDEQHFPTRRVTKGRARYVSVNANASSEL